MSELQGEQREFTWRLEVTEKTSAAAGGRKKAVKQRVSDKTPRSDSSFCLLKKTLFIKAFKAFQLNTSGPELTINIMFYGIYPQITICFYACVFAEIVRISCDTREASVEHADIIISHYIYTACKQQRAVFEWLFKP